MTTALVYMPEDLVKVHLAGASMERLRSLCDVEFAFGDLSEHKHRLAEVKVALTGWSGRPLDAANVAHLPRLGLIAHLGGSARGAATEQVVAGGVRVVNGAEANARPVAEYTLAMIVLANKEVPFWLQHFAARRDRAGMGDLVRQRTMGNCGRTIGLVGASRIGRRVAELLKLHDLQVVIADPVVDAADVARLGARHVSLNELLEISDVVSLHQPLLPATRKTFGAEQFARMRPGSTLINTARGAIVDTEALTEAAADGRINAILDVTDPEPLPSNSPLWDLPNVWITPHIAGSTGNEVQRMTNEVLDDVERYLRGEALRNEFHLSAWTSAA